MSSKLMGGGMCRFVDSNWATQLHIHERAYTTDYSQFNSDSFICQRQSLRFTIVVKSERAASQINESFNTALSRSVDQPVLIVGHFDSCDLSSHLPPLQQHKDCPTWHSWTLDQCFGDVPNASGVPSTFGWRSLLSEKWLCGQTPARRD